MAKSYKPKPRIGRPPDPDADWNVPEPDVAAMIAQCQRLLKKMKDAPADVWSRAMNFFEDVEKKVNEISTHLAMNLKPTAGQQKALNAWEGGVDKWLKGRTEHGR